tara:strand:+ start:427 stop:726 length:300 start_codon:yes stop_codon:yes gene_type:complete
MEHSLDRFTIEQTMSREQPFQQQIPIDVPMLVKNRAHKAVRPGLGDTVQYVARQVGCKCSAGGRSVDAAGAPDPGRDAEAKFNERLAHQRRKSWQSPCG